MDPALALRLSQRARAPLLPIPRLRAAAAHRSLAPGLARPRLRGAVGGVARRGAVRGRQVGARLRAGGAGPRRDSPVCSATRAAASRSRRNTHELVVRLLSALPLRTRPRLVTTDGEFHTIRRQLDRLAEEGLAVDPGARGAARLARRADWAPRWTTAPRWCWSRRSSSTPAGSPRDLDRGGRELPAARGGTAGRRRTTRSTSCRSRWPTRDWPTPSWSGGGYKYCQLGEGNCFLRIPQGSELRPVMTGWYSEFTALADRQRPDRVAYGPGRRPVRRRDVRSDQPLPGGRGVRLLPGAGADAARCCAR